jgi:hypothetical protein
LTLLVGYMHCRSVEELVGWTDNHAGVSRGIKNVLHIEW